MRRTHFEGMFAVVLGLLTLALFVRPAEAIDLRDWGTKSNNAGNRFVLKFNGAAVLDRETQLVWEQSPDTNVKSWALARTECMSRDVDGRKGWRLPSVHELASLVDPSQLGLSLLPGHPFSNVQTEHYWSATTNADSPTDAWTVRFLQTGPVGTFGKNNGLYVWCVRGGFPGPDTY
jgi:hypothetical protein